jgi:hypothetical protein
MTTHQSIADISEQEMIERLTKDDYWRRNLFGIEGVPNDPLFRLSVRLDGIPGNPQGDVDILLIAPNQYHIATGIQVKRVKVSMSEVGAHKINKLIEYEKAVKQANLLIELGFAQVFLFVFVVVDSRAMNRGKYAFEGVVGPHLEIVDQQITARELDPRIGLFRQEFVQPMNDEPLTTGAYTCRMIQNASRQAQRQVITEWVSKAFTSTS